MAIPGRTRFSISASGSGGVPDATTKLEFKVVDGNGQPVGDIVVSEGVG